MLHTRKYISCIFILLLMLVSCKKDFLEVDPKGLLIAKNTADYDLLLNNASLVLFTPISTPVMGDEAAGVNEFFSTLNAGTQSLADQKAFRWEDDIYLPVDNTSEYTSLIKQAYIYNKIINEVPSSAQGNETQKAGIKAEALAGRAWVNFMLANLYGKPYNEATAATDLGTPLAKEANISQTEFTRATIKEMYDLMIADLSEAIPALPNATTKLRMSKAAGEALLAKIYVYMGKFDKALPLLEAAVKDIGTATMPLGLYDFNIELAAGGTFYPSNPILGPPRSNPNTDKEILYMRRNPLNLYWYLSSGVVINPEAMKLFKGSDKRKSFMSSFSFDFSVMFPQGMMRAYGRPYYNMGVNMPDIYLLKAECKARLGDTGSAANELLAFRKNRMSQADAALTPEVANDQVALTKFILEERIREFPLTGERWFDMRRLSVDPIYKSTVTYTHRIYDKNGNITATYTLKPERLTFRFPQYIMAANPNMPQNP